jgi:hypothetical protein
MHALSALSRQSIFRAEAADEKGESEGFSSY